MTVRHIGPSAGATRQDISGSVTATLVRYVRARVGDAGVDQMLAFAGERRSVSELEDPSSWSYHHEAVALLSAAMVVTGDNSIGLHIGQELLRERGGTDVATKLRALGSPEALLQNVTAALAKFNTVSIVEPLELGDHHAVIRALTRPGYERHVQLCEFTKGILSQVPALFGQMPAMVSESECQARGGRFCVYSLEWSPHIGAVDPQGNGQYLFFGGNDLLLDPDHLTADQERVAGLERQLAVMGERLEGVFSAAAELLSDQDISTLLARIVSRAGHAVSAPRYLLVVRTAPDAPVQLHHHGFNPTEAQALANELWREHPDEMGGSRLIVDVASSRRRYGRLAAVYPPGARFFESERQILRLYAGYAATALDVVTSLEEARRSDAIARALLDFSEALARSSTTDEVVQHLCDAVTKTLDCSHASVLLWDPDTETLGVRSRTSGTVSPMERFRPDGLANVELDERGELVIRREHAPLVNQMMNDRSVLVATQASSDPVVSAMMRHAGIATSVLAPLASGDEFLGIVAANFRVELSNTVVNRRELRGRLSGLADHSVTALQNVRLLERVTHLAWHDTVTGLPNRRLLEDRVNQELARARRVGQGTSIFFVDLDRLKAVNDSYGHAAGDELIRQVARRIEATVRRHDTVARLGGDEFAVLLPGLVDRSAIRQLAKRTLESLHAPYDILGNTLESSASIGIAIAPDNGDTFDELLSRADEAMYRAKRAGRDSYRLFDEESPERPGAGGSPEDVEAAIEDGQFFLLYQPYIDLETTRVVGVEALVRWRHPTRGVLEPASFIPVLEHSRAIVALDSWVLAEACRQLRRWSDDGLEPLKLSVNVASRDLSDPGLVDTVRRIVEETQVDPALLELEISERVVLDEEGRAALNVEELQELGVRFSIDDFGGGGSSIDRIGAFPVSTIKIDKSFVQVLGPENESGSIVAAIIAMARRLGLQCMAEGVETSHQSRVLLQRGCTTAQGFFFSPPLLANDIERLLHDGIPAAGAPEAAAGDQAS